jgi:hypothetical protein
VLKKERETLLSMRSQYIIGDDVLHDVLREMDLLAARFHHEEEEASLHDRVEASQLCRQAWCYSPWLRKWWLKWRASPV